MRNVQKASLIYLSPDNDNIRVIEKMRILIQKLEIRPKLGLDYLCAALKTKGVEPVICDQMLMDFKEKDLVTIFQKTRPDLIGFYVCLDNFEKVLSFIREIKRVLSIPIIAGGPGYVHYDGLIKAGCEIVCLGEGDETIADIVDYYEGKKSLDEIGGIAYCDRKGEIVAASVRPLVNDLDRLPFPFRNTDMINRYFDYLAYPLKKPYISMACSRGCLYSCAFCTSHLIWRRQYRQRSVEGAIDEIKEAVFKFNIKSICFIDDVFAANFNWLKEFCGALNREKLNLRWMCELHPMTFKGKKRDAFLMMAESGCRLVSFGGQSANAEVLKNINRDSREPEELAESIQLAKEMNLTTVINYIFGLPGDTLKTLRQNFDFCLEAKPHLVDFHPLVILPGSELALKYKNKLFCGVDEKEIKRLCGKYMINYYMKPAIFSQLLRDVLNKNPGWFFSIMRFGPEFFRSLFLSGKTMDSRLRGNDIKR